MKFILSVILMLAAMTVLCEQGAMPVVTDIAAMSKVGDKAGVSVTNSEERAEMVRRLKDAPAFEDVKEPGVPLEGISFPMGMYENGSVRVQFKAEKAFYPSDVNAFVYGQKIRMELFTPGGRLEGVLLADDSVFDRKMHIGYSVGRVRMQYRNFKLLGTNMVWDADTRNVRIEDGARVEMLGFMKNLGSVFKR